MKSVKGLLAQDNFYGRTVVNDIRIGISFTGKPKTKKGHKLKNVDVDVTVDDVYLPTKKDEDRYQSTTEVFEQEIVVSGAKLDNDDGWMDIGGQGYTKDNAGKLTIAAFSSLTGTVPEKVFLFECSDACPTSYDTSGNLHFICSGAINWDCRCKTNLKDNSKSVCSQVWNNLEGA